LAREIAWHGTTRCKFLMTSRARAEIKNPAILQESTLWRLLDVLNFGQAKVRCATHSHTYLALEALGLGLGFES
jgi:hypothetical protein